MAWTFTRNSRKVKAAMTERRSAIALSEEEVRDWQQRNIRELSKWWSCSKNSLGWWVYTVYTQQNSQNCTLKCIYVTVYKLHSSMNFLKRPELMRSASHLMYDVNHFSHVLILYLKQSLWCSALPGLPYWKKDCIVIYIIVLFVLTISQGGCDLLWNSKWDNWWESSLATVKYYTSIQ